MKRILLALAVAVSLTSGAQNKLDNSLRTALDSNQGGMYSVIVEFNGNDVNFDNVPVETVTKVGNMAVVYADAAQIQKLSALPQVKRVSMGPDVKALSQNPTAIEKASCPADNKGIQTKPVKAQLVRTDDNGHACPHQNAQKQHCGKHAVKEGHNCDHCKKGAQAAEAKHCDNCKKAAQAAEAKHCDHCKKGEQAAEAKHCDNCKKAAQAAEAKHCDNCKKGEQAAEAKHCDHCKKGDAEKAEKCSGHECKHKKK